MNMVEQAAALKRTVMQIDSIDASDPEKAHARLDEILLSSAHPEVREATQRLIDRCGWWASA